MDNPYKPPQSPLNDRQEQWGNEQGPFLRSIPILLNLLGMVVVLQGVAEVVGRGSPVTGLFSILCGGVWFWAASAVRHNSPYRWIWVVTPAVLWGAIRDIAVLTESGLSFPRARTSVLEFRRCR